jgi:ABC-type Zn uptake system ZnuABC Zn-binding protein ZnuA
MRARVLSRLLPIAVFVPAGLAAPAEPRAEPDPLAVCVTTASLGSLVRDVGGDAVSPTVFAKGTEDPHFVEPRPSFVKELNRADLLVLNGMDLEIGWLPALIQSARNPRVRPGAVGYLDASTAIAPLEVPTGAVDRSMGDVHIYGNPHYLLDPLNGLAVARLIRDRLTELRPERAAAFAQGYADFIRRVVAALVGPELARRYDAEKLAVLALRAKLVPFLESQGQVAELGGWLGLQHSRDGMRAVSDHRLWAYFARRFGLQMVGTLEPRPGVPPTTRHLRQLVERMRAEDVKLILSASYYDPAPARFVAEHTGARIAAVAQDVGARAGTESYLAMIDHNVREVLGNDGGS